jgi:hypothetical protein
MIRIEEKCNYELIVLKKKSKRVRSGLKYFAGNALKH